MVLVKRWLRKCGGPEGTRDNGKTKKEKKSGKKKKKEIETTAPGDDAGSLSSQM